VTVLTGNWLHRPTTESEFHNILFKPILCCR